MKQYKLILGIESSCDDTSIALFDSDKNTVLKQFKKSQLVHAGYGGVVPEIASREHLQIMPELYDQLIDFITDQRITNNIDMIAVTTKPGLIGSLLIGTSFAKALAWSLDLPLVGVDHLEAHIFSIFIENEPLEMPFLSLLVSGGHTHLYLVKGFKNYTLLGRSLDDACGEAFDKAASMMGIAYPGGPNIESLAKLASSDDENYLPLAQKRFKLPIAMSKNKNLNFSYSGLKTALRRLLIENALYAKKTQQPLINVENISTYYSKNAITNLAQIAASFQNAATGQLTAKVEQAVKQTKVTRLSVCGGVASNMVLKAELAKLSAKYGLQFLAPKPAYNCDNGAMIAYYAHLEQNVYKTGALADLELEPSAISPLSSQ